MNRDFFVLLTHPNTKPVPLTNSIEDLVYFESYEKAVNAAKSSILGEFYGYEVFQLGCGE